MCQQRLVLRYLLRGTILQGDTCRISILETRVMGRTIIRAFDSPPIGNHDPMANMPSTGIEEAGRGIRHELLRDLNTLILKSTDGDDNLQQISRVA